MIDTVAQSSQNRLNGAEGRAAGLEMFVAGAWRRTAEEHAIRSPYSGELVDVVGVAGVQDVEDALASAVRGAAAMRSMPAAERYEILMRAASLLESQVEDFARTISLEEGKPIGEARGEASRSPDLIRLAAFEGSQIRGETLPMDAQKGGAGKVGFTLRTPCGVVVAISPFNYPLLLVLHKIAPALAAGNAVILKPAGQTPLTALKLTKILIEAGLPPESLQCITGEGAVVGARLCADPRVRKISFTGSVPVGEAICHAAGIKRVTMELGSNAAMVVLPDANIEKVAEVIASGGFVNAGQVCISLQRVLAQRKIYGYLLDAVRDRVAALPTGDPFAPESKVSALISEHEAERVQRWIAQDVANGARVVTGGTRDRALHAPTVVADVQPKMHLFQDELFGPAVGFTPFETVDEAIAHVNDSRYGLAASIFTEKLGHAMRFVREADCGNVHVNWSPLWRADFMPYGGVKVSGFGKEGPRYAVEEMTESKTVVIHGETP